MKNSKLLKILGALSEEEWSKLKQLLKNTKTNNAKLKLFQHIERSRNNLNSNTLSITYINNNILESFSRKRILNTASSLYKDVFDFLLHQELEKDKRLRDNLSLKILRDKGLFNLHERKFHQAEKNLNSLPIDLWSDFWWFRLYFDVYYSDLPEKYKSGQQFFGKINRYLDEFICTSNNLLNISILNRNRIWKEDWAERKILLSTVHDSPAAYTLSLCLQVLRNRDDSAVQRLEQEFVKNNSLDKPLLIIVGTCLASYYRHLYSNGLGVAKKLFFVYSTLDARNAITTNNTISSLRFSNAVTVACSIENNNVQWAKYFVEKYKIFISSKNKNNLVLLAKVEINLCEGDTHLALQHLATLQTADSVIKFKALHLQLKAYYEEFKNDPAILLGYVDNIKQTLRRNSNKYSQRELEAAHNLCHIITVITKTKSKDVANKALNKTKNVSHRSWLQAKVMELR